VARGCQHAVYNSVDAQQQRDVYELLISNVMLGNSEMETEAAVADTQQR
jgi:hypothetical protein